MSIPRLALSVALAAMFLLPPRAGAETCDLVEGSCQKNVVSNRSSSGASAGSPSSNSSFRLNPAAVPVEDSFGVGAIFYRGMPDLGLVRGLGRVGAALSPSNGEETFFGPPGFELNEDLLRRKNARDKYESQKYSAAAAFALLQSKGSGWRRFQLNLGLLGKYNKVSGTAWPGAGLSVQLGPLTLGYAAAADEFVVDYSYFGSDRKDYFRYGTQTASASLYLGSAAFDWSMLTIYPQFGAPLVVNLGTASVILSRFIFTASIRQESSDRPGYDFERRQLTVERDKSEVFGGLQISVWRGIIGGVFYNYYLLKEYSAGLTVFF